MLLARDELGHLVRATPRGSAYCPTCDEALIAKCGSIVTWHWAHHAQPDCDTWHRGETQWHLDWKARYADAGYAVELPCTLNGERHRADVVTSRAVLELQGGSLSAVEIRRREAFYGRDLIWLYRIASFADRILLGRNASRGGVGFRVRNGPLSLGLHRRPLYFDVSESCGCGVRCGVWEVACSIRTSYWGGRRLVGRVRPVAQLAGLTIGSGKCQCLNYRRPFDDDDDEIRWDALGAVRQPTPLQTTPLLSGRKVDR